MVNNMEEVLKMLKRMGVRSAKVWLSELEGRGYVLENVEFFPEAANDNEELEKKPRADEKVNEATGLTRSQTRDILNMDE